MQWHEAVAELSRFVVKISTPRNSGTGFLVRHFKPSENLAHSSESVIATANHVTENAEKWEDPIRITHPASGNSVLLRRGDYTLYGKPTWGDQQDVALLTLRSDTLPFPSKPPALAPRDKLLKVGQELGWLGFPCNVRESEKPTICFFSGRISAHPPAGMEGCAYLLDGVSINGVSGGPAFHLTPTGIRLVGVVTHFFQNPWGTTGLTGLQDVSRIHEWLEFIKKTAEQSEGEAKGSKRDMQGNPIR